MYQALLLLTVGRVWELALSCSYLRTMQRNYLGCDVVFAGALLCVASGEEIAGSYPESELIV